jgi:hypothetical protein
MIWGFSDGEGFGLSASSIEPERSELESIAFNTALSVSTSEKVRPQCL